MTPRPAPGRREGTRPSWLALGLAFALALSPIVAAAPEEPEIAFVSPRHLSTALGPTTVSLELRLPGGSAVARVELRVDGQPLATLTRPPWTVEWDAGDGSRGHALEAVLLLADGRRARAAVRTSPLRIDQVEHVDLVNLYAIVLDDAGRYVSELGREDFRIFESGRPQSIERFTTERKPLRVAIVLDTSASMGEGKGAKLRNAQEAALEFLEVLETGDEGMVVAFNDRVQVLQDLTPRRERLASAIQAVEARGGTALYDSIWRTSRKLRDFEGRRVLVLLSDGQDQAYNGMEPGSLHTLEEALDQALRSEVMVFTIGLGRRLDQTYAIRFGPLGGRSNVDTERSVESILRQLAEATGGRAFISPGSSRLRKAFRDVAEDLRNQYSIAYVSDDPEKDGSWREIRVTLPGREHQIITRRGYYALPRGAEAGEIDGTR